MLDDRRSQILQALVEEYIGTGEPVSSRAVLDHSWSERVERNDSQRPGQARVVRVRRASRTRLRVGSRPRRGIATTSITVRPAGCGRPPGPGSSPSSPDVHQRAEPAAQGDLGPAVRHQPLSRPSSSVPDSGTEIGQRSPPGAARRLGCSGGDRRRAPAGSARRVVQSAFRPDGSATWREPRRCSSECFTADARSSRAGAGAGQGCAARETSRPRSVRSSARSRGDSRRQPEVTRDIYVGGTSQLAELWEDLANVQRMLGLLEQEADVARRCSVDDEDGTTVRIGSETRHGRCRPRRRLDHVRGRRARQRPGRCARADADGLSADDQDRRRSRRRPRRQPRH